MKRIVCLTLLLMMVTVTAQAKLIEMEAKANTAHGCRNSIMTTTNVTASFGKIPSPGDYGVFIRVSCRADNGDNQRGMETFTFFFRPVHGEIKRDGDFLYIVDADGTTRLAKKSWTGWKTVPGVKLLKRFQGSIVDVSIQID
jgi:hypothetical protein